MECSEEGKGDCTRVNGLRSKLEFTIRVTNEVAGQLRRRVVYIGRISHHESGVAEREEAVDREASPTTIRRRELALPNNSAWQGKGTRVLPRRHRSREG